MPPELKYFLCTGECVERDELYKYPHSHIMGHLQYLEDEGRKVTALARWEESVPANTVTPLKPAVDCYFIGDARRIKCRYRGCENHQRWEIGRAGRLALMSKLGKQDAFLKLEKQDG